MTFPFININDLETFSFIAGSQQELIFNVYSGSVGANLAGYTGTWMLAPYGESDAVLTKVGTVSGSSMTITLNQLDTIRLSGKYVHQPILTAISGSMIKPSQGIITIAPALV